MNNDLRFICIFAHDYEIQIYYILSIGRAVIC